MTAPVPTQYANGTAPVTGDQFNTFVQGCNSTPQLRGVVGVPGLSIELFGGV